MRKSAEKKSNLNAAVTLAPAQAEAGEFLTKANAARAVGVSIITINRRLRAKLLTRFKFGARTLISRAELIGLVRKAE
jgi:precorrin-6x reductase